MVVKHQSSQPEANNGFASRHDLREAICSAGAKYRRERRQTGQNMVSATIRVTCHLCQFDFEQPVSEISGTISCPSCGMRFELKHQFQVDSIQIEQIEQELARLRTEIETKYPQRSVHREKSVIGPLPMQTLKKSFDSPHYAQEEDKDNRSGLDRSGTTDRVRSCLVRLEKDQLEDYLRWRDSLPKHRPQYCEPEVIREDAFEEQKPYSQVEQPSIEPLRCPSENGVSPATGGNRATFADYVKCLRTRKLRYRIKFAIAGIIFCVVLCAALLTMDRGGSDNPSQQASRETPGDTEIMLMPTEIIDVPSLREHNVIAEKEKLPAQEDRLFVPPPMFVPNAMVPTPAPIPAFQERVLEIPMPLSPSPVDSAVELESEMVASLDRQLMETQSQLTHLSQQYELTRQTNEQLERTAKQNEAESLLWEAYANTDKSPIRSMVLSLQAIERFKELELDVPNNASWVLNQSLASQDLGIAFNGFQGGVDAMTLSGDGQWFLFAGNDGTVWLWDISRHDETQGSFCVDMINGGVVQLAMSSNLNLGFCVGRNGAIRIWNMRVERPFEQPVDIADARCHFTNMTVSEDGRWLAAYGQPNRQGNNGEMNDVFLWDLNPLTRNGGLGTPIVLKGHQKPIRSLAISSNSRWLVSGSEDQTVRVYDLKTAYPAAEQIVLKGHELAVNCVTVSPDGRWLVTGGCDSILRIWDMQSRQSMATPIELQEHEGWITSLAFSPDGRWLASGSYDSTIRLWRMIGVNRPEVAQVLTGHINRIKSVEFSRQGNRLVSLGSDREVRLWNLEQGDPSENVLVFRNSQVPISSVKLTGDGKWLILAQQKPNVAGSTGLRLWPLVFDETFDFAAHYAETRFPTLYQRRQNSFAPMLERQEERIAGLGGHLTSGASFAGIPEFPVPEQPTREMPPNAASQSMAFVPNPMQSPQIPQGQFPPYAGQVNQMYSGINISLTPQSSP